MPSLLLFPFHLLCPPWPGPLSSSLASQCLGSLKMLITPGFLLVPRIFLFIKPGQTLPRGGTHTRAGTLSNPRGCFSFPFLISIPGPFFFSFFLGSPLCLVLLLDELVFLALSPLRTECRPSPATACCRITDPYIRKEIQVFFFLSFFNDRPTAYRTSRGRD